MKHSAAVIGSAAGLRRYVANTSWLSAERVLRLFVAFFVGIYLARYLGVEQFGVYSYVLALCGLIGAAAKLGLDDLLIREMSKRDGSQELYIGTAFWIQLAAVALAVAGAAVILLREPPTATGVLLIIALAGLLFQPFLTIDAFFKSQVLAKYSSMASAAQLIVSSTFKLVLIAAEADLILFVVVAAFDYAWLAVVLFALYNRMRLPGFFRRFDSKLALGLLRKSWPLVFAGVAITVYMRIDQVMLMQMAGVTETGLYSAAVRISEAVNVLPVIVGTSLFPALVAANAADADRFRERSLVLFEALLLTALVAACLITVSSSAMIGLLYGQEFQAAGHILRIHVWSVPFVFLGVASARWLLARDLGLYLMLRAVGGALVNVALNFVLIPRYGAAGAAFATVLSFAFAAVVMNGLSKRTRECFFLQLRAILCPGGALFRQLKMVLTRT